MVEIRRLRNRLKNVGKNTTEYRMTVVEAKALLAEIDKLMEPAVVQAPVMAEVKAAPVTIEILDGGSLG
jgi:hypothetical protein